VSDDEMDRVFNMGLGMVLVVPAIDVDGVVATLAAHDRPARVIGELVTGSGQVRMEP
jgi:phosphoribosylformylglycinamidine cyclo-ligase